jgi:hypothetical protein
MLIMIMGTEQVFETLVFNWTDVADHSEWF